MRFSSSKLVPPQMNRAVGDDCDDDWDARQSSSESEPTSADWLTQAKRQLRSTSNSNAPSRGRRRSPSRPRPVQDAVSPSATAAAPKPPPPIRNSKSLEPQTRRRTQALKVPQVPLQASPAPHCPIPHAYISIIHTCFGPHADLYADVLNMTRSDNIRVAYFRRGRAVLQPHTDTGNSVSPTSVAISTESNKQAFQAVTRAYEILTNPDYKAYYEEHGLVVPVAQQHAPSSPGAGNHGDDADDDCAFGNSSFESVASVLRKGHTRSRSVGGGVRWNEEVEELVYEPILESPVPSPPAKPTTNSRRSVVDPPEVSAGLETVETEDYFDHIEARMEGMGAKLSGFLSSALSAASSDAASVTSDSKESSQSELNADESAELESLFTHMTKPPPKITTNDLKRCKRKSSSASASSPTAPRELFSERSKSSNPTKSGSSNTSLLVQSLSGKHARSSLPEANLLDDTLTQVSSDPLLQLISDLSVSENSSPEKKDGKVYQHNVSKSVLVKAPLKKGKVDDKPRTRPKKRDKAAPFDPFQLDTSCATTDATDKSSSFEHFDTTCFLEKPSQSKSTRGGDNNKYRDVPETVRASDPDNDSISTITQRVFRETPSITGCEPLLDLYIADESSIVASLNDADAAGDDGDNKEEPNNFLGNLTRSAQSTFAAAQDRIRAISPVNTIDHKSNPVMPSPSTTTRAVEKQYSSHGDQDRPSDQTCLSKDESLLSTITEYMVALANDMSKFGTKLSNDLGEANRAMVQTMIFPEEEMGGVLDVLGNELGNDIRFHGDDRMSGIMKSFTM